MKSTCWRGGRRKNNDSRGEGPIGGTGSETPSERKEQRAFKRTMLGMILMALATTAAWSYTDEEKCIHARAKAKAKYDYCVGRWLAKVYGSSTFFPVDDPTISPIPANDKLARCRSKYFSVWPKLEALIESPTCNQKRFADNIDGTVTDNLTGLTWEKKDRSGGVHQWDQGWNLANEYPGLEGNGTAYTTFLAILNSTGFAGTNDWRLPTFAELLTILLPEPCSSYGEPCVPSVFNAGCIAGCTLDNCSCTADEYAVSDRAYLTAKVFPFSGYDQWTVAFVTGDASYARRYNLLPVRAVRGGP